MRILVGTDAFVKFVVAMMQMYAMAFWLGWFIAGLVYLGAITLSWYVAKLVTRARMAFILEQMDTFMNLKGGEKE